MGIIFTVLWLTFSSWLWHSEPVIPPAPEVKCIYPHPILDSGKQVPIRKFTIGHAEPTTEYVLIGGRG